MRYILFHILILLFTTKLSAQYDGGDGSGNTLLTYNITNCYNYLGNSGSGQNASILPSNHSCGSFAGGENSGHNSDTFDNPYSCIQFSASVNGKSGYDSRKLSNDLTTCVILTLPIDSSPLFGEIQDQNGLLYWKTYSEINNKGFEILKSTDGINWFEIGWIDGAINSSSTIEYEFLDMLLQNGNNFYRFRQIDMDGQSDLSNVVNLNTSHQANQLSHFVLYPNPIGSNDYLKIRSWTNNDSEIQMKIFDGIGRFLLEDSFVFNNDQQVYQFHIPFSPGTYYLIVENIQTGVSKSFPFIVR